MTKVSGPDCPSWMDSGFWMRASVRDVRNCLAEGADVMERAEDGRTPLHMAATKSLEIMRTLINAGAEIDAQNEIGIAAIHLVAEQGNAEKVRLLVESGANIEIRNRGCRKTRLLLAWQVDHI